MIRLDSVMIGLDDMSLQEPQCFVCIPNNWLKFKLEGKKERWGSNWLLRRFDEGAAWNVRLASPKATITMSEIGRWIKAALRAQNKDIVMVEIDKRT